jgi:hypothetical protein
MHAMATTAIKHHAQPRQEVLYCQVNPAEIVLCQVHGGESSLQVTSNDKPRIVAYRYNIEASIDRAVAEMFSFSQVPADYWEIKPC